MTTPDHIVEAIVAAKALLARIDNLTTAEFELGCERVEREALRDALDALALSDVA